MWVIILDGSDINLYRIFEGHVVTSNHADICHGKKPGGTAVSFMLVLSPGRSTAKNLTDRFLLLGARGSGNEVMRQMCSFPLFTQENHIAGGGSRREVRRFGVQKAHTHTHTVALNA